jgi:hypothetical protein
MGLLLCVSAMLGDELNWRLPATKEGIYRRWSWFVDLQRTLTSYNDAGSARDSVLSCRTWTPGFQAKAVHKPVTAKTPSDNRRGFCDIALVASTGCQ